MTDTPAQNRAVRSPRSTWALVCGVVGVIGLMPFVPFLEYLFAPVAIVLGVLGLGDASRGVRGRGLAVSGIVLGVLTLLAIGVKAILSV